MPDYLRYYYSCPATLIGDYGYDRVQYLKTREVEITCDHLVDQFLVVRFIEAAKEAGLGQSSGRGFQRI